MGYKLVEAAFAFVASHNASARDSGGRELDATEVSLLLLMAHRAVDDDPEPAFWLRRAEICSSLGIRPTEAGKKRVQRAMSALAAASAVALPEKYQRGYTPRYRLIYQGGCSASTPSGQVWTPGIPLTGSKGDAQRPQVWTPGIPSMDAEHPPEEEEQKEEEEARASIYHLTEPPAWDADLPEPRNADEAARCARHPNGTKANCSACGANRVAWQDTHRPKRRPRPEALRHRLLDGRRICANRPHQLTADGTCANCELRPEEHAPIGALA